MGGRFSVLRVVVAGLSMLACAGANATVMSFSDFSDVSSLSINGDATTTTTDDGTVLRLTSAQTNQAGSAFSESTIQASAAFSSFFQFRITGAGGSVFDCNTSSGADGLVFVLQSVSSSIGGDGAGIGYEGIGNSVGIEFDSWCNTANNDPDSNHIAIDLNGSVVHSDDSGSVTSVSTSFDDGNIWSVWIDYDGEVLEVRANETGERPDDALITEAIDLTSILGQDAAYIGFTSGTGLDYGNHDILSWEYRDYYAPITSDVPEPCTALLFVSAISAGAIVRKRKCSRAH